MKKNCLTQKIKNSKEKGYVLNNKIFLGEYNFEQSDSLSGVYTGDANCYPQHITKGKTAYVKGEKITGTFKYDYWDSNITIAPSDKIMEGYEFYTAPGTQVVGTLPRFDLAVERSDSNAKITLSDDLVMSIPSGYIFGREPYSWGSAPHDYVCRIIDVFSETTATKFDIKANVTAFTKEYDTSVELRKVEGRIYPSSNYSLTEITPGADHKEIRSGNWNFDRFYTDSKTVLGDPNLIPENIKAGISIFGVQGTWLSENATATSNDIAYDLSAVVNYSIEHGSLSTKETFSFTPTSSYGISSKIYKNLTILPEENLKPENIMVGNTILGVEGAYTNDATATSGDFINYYELTSGQIFTKRNTGFVKGNQLYGSGDLIDRRHTVLPYYEDKDGKFYMAKGFYSGTTGAIKTGSVGGNATPDSILLGKTAYVNGEKITGTLTLKELDIYPSNVNQIYNDKGLYKIKINTPNSVNLKPENIKSGVDIWGVTGSYAPKESNLDERIFKCIEVDTSSKTFKGEVMTKMESYYKPSGTYINSIPYNLVVPEVGCYYLWGCYGKVTNIMLEQIDIDNGLLCKTNNSSTDFVEMNPNYTCLAEMGYSFLSGQQDFGGRGSVLYYDIAYSTLVIGPIITIHEDFTMSAWIKTDRLYPKSIGLLFAFSSDSYSGKYGLAEVKTEDVNYELKVILGAKSVEEIQNSDITVGQLGYGNWNHIVFTRRVFVGADYIDYNYRTFLNGEEIHNTTLQNGDIIDHVYMNGGYLEGDVYCEGIRLWNSVRIYNRCLDDEEIQYLYQNKL